jgi:serine/threonine protein kinase
VYRDLAYEAVSTSTIVSMFPTSAPTLPAGLAGAQMTPRTQVDLTRLVPKDYLILQRAGQGLTSEVFFCLRRATDPSNSTDESTRDENITAGKSDVVAVKVLHQPFMHSNTEISFLRRIRSELGNESVSTANRFQEFITCNPGFDIHSQTLWIATKAICGSITLSDIERQYRKRKECVPEEFILHAFLQVSEALLFLHESCEPPIAHGDVHFGNVLLDERQDTPGFPNLVLIDFGSARTVTDMVSQSERLWQDMWLFYNSIFGLCTTSERTRVHPSWWPEFCDSVFMSLSRGHMESLQDLQDAYGIPARVAIAGTSATTLAEIKEHILDVVAREANAVEGMLEKGLELDIQNRT